MIMGQLTTNSEHAAPILKIYRVLILLEKLELDTDAKGNIFLWGPKFLNRFDIEL